MALQRENFFPGSTSVLLRPMLLNSSVTTGAGITGLTAGSSGLTCYYMRDGDTTSTAISLVTGTVGTWSSGGFKEVDATHMPGVYEFGIPNAVLATGVKKATIFFHGATNMQDTFIDIDMLETGDAYAAIATTTVAESAAVPAATATLTDKIRWLATIARNKITTTATTQTLLADDNATTVGASTISDDGSTATRGKYV
jgi:hypothetical protein